VAGFIEPLQPDSNARERIVKTLEPGVILKIKIAQKLNALSKLMLVSVPIGIDLKT
jgi:hypothetical protein